MLINLGGITYHCDTAAPWISTEIFVKGCLKRCKGCFNPQLQELGGDKFEVDELVELMIKHVPYKKVTISGGEPFLQLLPLIDLVHKLKSAGFTIICYTGYTWEEIQSMHGVEKLLSNLDILVDGPFKIKQINQGTGYESGKWVGSSNQRIIDVQQTKKENKVILWKN